MPKHEFIDTTPDELVATPPEHFAVTPAYKDTFVNSLQLHPQQVEEFSRAYGEITPLMRQAILITLKGENPQEIISYRDKSNGNLIGVAFKK